MLNDTKPVPISEVSDLARLLERADRAPLVLEKGGVRYRLSKADAFGEVYDASSVRAAIRKTAGIWNDGDAEALIAAVYHAREAGTRPLTRP